jgi:hypothetical protein
MIPANTMTANRNIEEVLAHMNRQVELAELLLGVEGLALLRTMFDCTDAEANGRLAGIHSVLATADEVETVQEVDA